jgi:ribosomal protein L11 methyltransferase
MLLSAARRLAPRTTRLRCAQAPALLRVRLLDVPGPLAEPLADDLLEAGALSVTSEDAQAGTAQEVSLYVEDVRARAKAAGGSVAGDATWARTHVTALLRDAAAWEELKPVAEARLGAAAVAAALLDYGALQEAGWQAAMRGAFQPLLVLPAGSDAAALQGRALWVLPSWAEPSDASALNLRLEPGLAFGTGEHPTTRLCLAALARSLAGGEAVLDVGTGSGVLAAGALALGAAVAAGTDVEPLAITAAAATGRCRQRTTLLLLLMWRLGRGAGGQP